MRAVSRPHASTEPQPLIELGRRRILRTQPENVESAPGRRDDPADQLPANPEAPIGRQDVQMPHPGDALRQGIRIDVEPAHADHSPTYQGSKEGLTGAVKPIRSAGPLFSEPAHEPPPGLLALGDQGINGLGRQVTQAFDDHAVAPADASLVPRWPTLSSRLAAPDEDMQTSSDDGSSSPLRMERVQPCAPLGFGNGARLDGRVTSRSRGTASSRTSQGPAPNRDPALARSVS